MVIRANGGVIDPYGGYPKLIYDVSIFDPSMTSRIWRARVDNSGGTALMTKRFRTMAEKLKTRLKQDGLL